jgi:hypothetical protein
MKNVIPYLKLVKDNPAFSKDADYYTFIISLLPIPVVQQAGQILNKIVNDHSLKTKFDDIKREIFDTNEKIEFIGDELERIREIAKSVNQVSKFERKVEALSDQLLSAVKQENTEFVIDTQRSSVQVLIKQIIDADFVGISAIDGSQNVIRGTQIAAKNTRLTAHDNSMNYIDVPSFHTIKALF